MKKNLPSAFLATFIICAILSCQSEQGLKETAATGNDNISDKKVVVYQVFTRLFGNKNTTNKMWGTIEENGVGKFNDFTEKALQEIKNLGVTHIWYTGVPHHCVITDYTKYGISNDDPDVVKGRAGSPYAVKDYYNVNPDLAVDPANRLAEFEALIARTHAVGLKVIIDIVPNHVARNYQSLSNPEGVTDFGANDDVSVEYSKNNNFYYIPNKAFKVPEYKDNYLPLGGEKHSLVDGKFDENPAKWTGNGSRLAQPDFYDWYETVKINYGVRPDGSYDFDTLPADYKTKSYKEHLLFWKDKKLPDSWTKFRDIALYWLDKGVDGFRYDMAEMVPVEFWSFMNSSIKVKNPEAFLLAEVYNPTLYRDYVFYGKMDYLYDKVELYDTLKNIIKAHGSTDNIAAIQTGMADIEKHLLHFLENHDEQRIASAPFAGTAEKAKPAMVLSACISSSPTLIYFAQELGEAGNGNAGFGTETRTTIFDYWGIPALQRWMNNGAFDGAKLTASEIELRNFYKTLLNFVIKSHALTGKYKEIHSLNRAKNADYTNKIFSFIRWKDAEKLIIISNFDDSKKHSFKLMLDVETMNEWQLEKGSFQLTEQLTGSEKYKLEVSETEAFINIEIEPLESLILKL